MVHRFNEGGKLKICAGGVEEEFLNGSREQQRNAEKTSRPFAPLRPLAACIFGQADIGLLANRIPD